MESGFALKIPLGNSCWAASVFVQETGPRQAKTLANQQQPTVWQSAIKSASA
jgi:hypothetical protein